MDTEIEVQTTTKNPPLRLTLAEVSAYYAEADDTFPPETAEGLAGADVVAGVLVRRALTAGAPMDEVQAVLRQTVYILTGELDPAGIALAALAGVVDQVTAAPYDRDQSPWADMWAAHDNPEGGTPTDDAIAHAILYYRNDPENFDAVLAVSSIFARYALCGTPEKRKAAYAEALDHMQFELSIVASPKKRAKRTRKAG